MMDAAVAGVMRRYGQAVEVGPAGEMASARAFLQPVIHHRKDDQQYLPTPLGRRPEEQYLYLGEPGRALEAGRDRVRWNGREFLITRAHPIYVGQSLSHWWALLRPADKEDL